MQHGAVLPFNPSLSDDLLDDAARIRGDAIGDTLYSSRFVLQTLLNLREYLIADGRTEPERQPPALSDNAACERDLCTLWDMSINRDVVMLLLEQDVLELFTVMINGSFDQRLCEILIGIIGNMCSVASVRHALCHSEFAFPSLLALVSCTDPLVLLQLMRLITAAITFDNNSDEEHWFRHFQQVPNFVEQFAALLANSLHSAMLMNAFDALACICSKFLVMENQPVATGIIRAAVVVSPPPPVTFRDLILTDSLVAAVFEAFHQLLPSAVAADDEPTDDASAPSKRTRKIVNTFLDIQVVLTQFDDASRSVYQPHLPALFACLAQILEPMCNAVYLFPMTFNDHGIIENVNDLLQSLGDPFSGACYVRMVLIWSLINSQQQRRSEREARAARRKTKADSAAVDNGWLPHDCSDDDIEADHELPDDADDHPNEFNVDDAVMTILEYLTRATKAATVDEMEACFRELGLAAMRTLYATLSVGDADPDIEASCVKLHQVASRCWGIDLNVDTADQADVVEADRQIGEGHLAQQEA